MNNIPDDTNRQVMPRWHSFGTACAMGDLRQLQEDSRKFSANDVRLGSKEDDWKSDPILPHAVDLVGSAILAEEWDNKDAIEASSFIMSSKHPSALPRQMAKHFKTRGKINVEEFLESSSDRDSCRFKIAGLKHSLRRFPNNGIAWAELAFPHTILGNDKQAVRAMVVALNIAPNNRYVLRASARCFLHFGLVDKALHYLRRSEFLAEDPWLLSAELAVSSAVGEKSKFARRAVGLLKEARYSPWSLNELAASVSTLEAQHGSDKKSKKLIRQALIKPNENTVAQAVWLKERLGISVPSLDRNVPGAFEADTRIGYQLRNYAAAAQSATNWFRYQPFSSRPVIIASYLASVCLQDDAKAISIIEESLTLPPKSFLLSNNYAFALASVNRTEEAENLLSKFDTAVLSPRELETLNATRGLIAFREGDIEAGRNLYKRAIEGFERLNELRAKAIAATFLAREESLGQTREAHSALLAANDLAGKANAPELTDLCASLKTNIPEK